jgi:hypothetical protein
MSDVTPEDHPVLDWRRSLDPRNEDFLARTVLPVHVPRARKDWAGPYIRLNQGRTRRGNIGACVGCGWVTEAMSTPVRYRPTPNTFDGVMDFALAVYDYAQAHDEYAQTPPEEGSSVNGGGKAAIHFGLITGYRWHRSVDDIIDALITDGPQVMGSDWLTGMFRPDEYGIIRATGAVEGGHCYCLTGYRPSYYNGLECVRLRNSWGGWGLNGDAFLPVDDLRALWSDGAECAMPIGRAYNPTH